MATRPFSDLYDYILPYVPSAETPLVDFHIRRVTREFCRRTTLWRRRIELTTEAGVADYILSPYDAALPGGGVGSGGSVGAWTLVHETDVPVDFLVTSQPNNGFADYYHDESRLVVHVNGDLGDTGLAFRFNMGVPGVGVQTRLTFTPAFTEEGSYNFIERGNFIEGSVQPLAFGAQFFSPLVPGSEDNEQGYFSGEYSSNGYQYWTPDPLEFGFVGEVLPIDYFRFSQGGVSGGPSFLLFEATIEVRASGGEPDICDPYSIISVVCDGRQIAPIEESARKPYGDRPLQAKPRAWYQPSARVLHLYPAPDAAYPITVDLVCALTMEPTLNVMPEFLLVDYREVIADGVISSLKMLNGKPWYDPEGAREAGLRFRQTTQAIRSRLRDAYQPGSFVARGPRFGR